MFHCHNQDHRSHYRRYVSGRAIGWRAKGYQGEDLGSCTDAHTHPYDTYAHWDEPGHPVP
jgi:hypothetical protein